MNDRSFKTLAYVAAQWGLPCSASTPIHAFRIDSRNVVPGDLFFALKGARVDGHAFLQEAARRGAVGAVVQKGYMGSDFGLPLLAVENVEHALQGLAAAFLAQRKTRVIGVTGSVGKTTTKDFLAAILEARYRVGKTPGNENTQLSLPLVLLNARGDEEVFVLEMGMERPGDLLRLISIAPPEIALVTQVALAHAAYFPGGMEDIARNKADIFLSETLKTALYCHELRRFSAYPPRQSSLSFSLDDKHADYFMQDGKILEKGRFGFDFSLPFSEKHWLHNFLAAASAARQMGLCWEEIAERIPHLKTAPMRFERFEKRGAVVINDAYNANPASMRAAFAGLPPPQAGGKRIGVLGAMASLGSFSEQAHREIGLLAQQYFDRLLVVGSEAMPLVRNFPRAECFDSARDAGERLREILRAGDVVLIKGSRIMRMEDAFMAL